MRSQQRWYSTKYQHNGISNGRGSHETSTIRSWIAAPVEQDIIVLWRLWCICKHWGVCVWMCGGYRSKTESRKSYDQRFSSRDCGNIAFGSPATPAVFLHTDIQALVLFDFYFLRRGFGSSRNSKKSEKCISILTIRPHCANRLCSSSVPRLCFARPYRDWIGRRRNNHTRAVAGSVVSRARNCTNVILMTNFRNDNMKRKVHVQICGCC